MKDVIDELEANMSQIAVKVLCGLEDDVDTRFLQGRLVVRKFEMSDIDTFYSFIFNVCDNFNISDRCALSSVLKDSTKTDALTKILRRLKTNLIRISECGVSTACVGGSNLKVNLMSFCGGGAMLYNRKSNSINGSTEYLETNLKAIETSIKRGIDFNSSSGEEDDVSYLKVAEDSDGIIIRQIGCYSGEEYRHPNLNIDGLFSKVSIFGR